jgi:hypothetical protein
MKNSPQSPDVPPTGRAGKMKTKHKAMAGGAVGLVLLGAYFLGGLFDGFGLGKGEGLGGGGDSGEPSKVINSTEEPETDPVSTVVPPGVNSGKVVVVLIDGDEYKVLKSPRSQFATTRAIIGPPHWTRSSRWPKTRKATAGIKVRVGMRVQFHPKSESRLARPSWTRAFPPPRSYEIDDTIP